MSAFTLELKNPPRQRIDVRSLTPQQLAEKTNKEIAALPLYHGNQKIQVGDLFKVSGRDKNNFHILSDSPKLDYIGAEITQGNITVEGNTGAYAGTEMKAGKLTITGDAGDYTGAGLVNGNITIQGNAGNFLGAALVGERQGMRGGSIIVKGNAGDRVADRLRRGTIIIRGKCGDYCASRMIAGNVAVLGKAGNNAGYNMKRGSLLFKRKPASIPSTFNENGQIDLPFMLLFFQHLQQMDKDLPRLSKKINIRRYLGDAACGGMGEILIIRK